MPRIPRKCMETLVFHIMTQGINKSYIFKKTEDKKFYIKTMYKLKDELRISIIAYCIMDNHTHMLVKAEEINDLSKYMLKLNTMYGQYYNKKYNRVGYVFRDRYRAEGIYTEQQLYACQKYIYDNPVKAGICEKASNYLYSNYKDIRKIKVEESYGFIDIKNDKNKVNEYIIENYLEENEITINDLKKEKTKLKKLIKILKDENKMSLREIAKTLEIGRETIRKMYK